MHKTFIVIKISLLHNLFKKKEPALSVLRIRLLSSQKSCHAYREQRDEGCNALYQMI